MDLLKKLEDCAQRYETVKEQILDPALVKDQKKYKEVMREKVVYHDPKDVFARIEALEAQFAAKQQEFKEKYL